MWELVPMTAPALAVICIAATVVRRTRAERPGTIDLTEVRMLSLDDLRADSQRDVLDIRGALVAPPESTLGGRMHEARQAPDGAGIAAPPRPGSGVRVRRRRPLVAARRTVPESP